MEDREEPDYGEGGIELVKHRIRHARARWRLEGWIVDGDLDLEEVGLTRLPLIKKVGRDFYCSNNRLITLEGAPKEVGWNFNCQDNELISLEGAPKELGGEIRSDLNQEEKS